MLETQQTTNVASALQITSIFQVMDAKVNFIAIFVYGSLTVALGYVECACGELSASPQCDISTGVCECINGGFGAKCDQCDFGYIGE